MILEMACLADLWQTSSANMYLLSTMANFPYTPRREYLLWISPCSCGHFHRNHVGKSSIHSAHLDLGIFFKFQMGFFQDPGVTHSLESHAQTRGHRKPMKFWLVLAAVFIPRMNTRSPPFQRKTNVAYWWFYSCHPNVLEFYQLTFLDNKCNNCNNHQLNNGVLTFTRWSSQSSWIMQSFIWYPYRNLNSPVGEQGGQENHSCDSPAMQQRSTWVTITLGNLFPKNPGRPPEISFSDGIGSLYPYHSREGWTDS